MRCLIDNYKLNSYEVMKVIKTKVCHIYFIFFSFAGSDMTTLLKNELTKIIVEINVVGKKYLIFAFAIWLPVPWSIPFRHPLIFENISE